MWELIQVATDVVIWTSPVVSMRSSVSTRTSSPFLGKSRPLLGKVRAPSFGAVAQLAERLHGMQEVRGSIPLSSTISFMRRVNTWTIPFLYET